MNTFDLDVTVFNRCDVRRIGRNMVLMITSTSSFDSFLAFSGFTRYALHTATFVFYDKILLGILKIKFIFLQLHACLWLTSFNFMSSVVIKMSDHNFKRLYIEMKEKKETMCLSVWGV